MENKNMIFVKMMNMSEKQNQQEKASLKTRWKQVRQELSRSVFNADKWINLWAELTPVEFNSETKTLTLRSNRGMMRLSLQHAYLVYAIELAFGQSTTVVLKVPEKEDIVLDDDHLKIPRLHDPYNEIIERWEKRAEENTPLEAKDFGQGNFGLMTEEEINAYTAKETLEMLKQLTPVLDDDHFVYIYKAPAALLRDSKAMNWLCNLIFKNPLNIVEFYCDEPLYPSLEERWEKVIAKVRHQQLHRKRTRILEQTQPVELADNQLTLKVKNYQVYQELKTDTFLLYRLAQEFGKDMVLLVDHPTQTGRRVSCIDTRWITDPKNEKALAYCKGIQQKCIDELNEKIQKGEDFDDRDFMYRILCRKVNPQQAKQMLERIELEFCSLNRLCIAKINPEGMDISDENEFNLHEMLCYSFMGTLGAYPNLIRE